MAKNTIILKNYSHIQIEENAVEAIMPGSLVELVPTGVQKHSTANGNAVKMFVIEDAIFGKTIDDALTISETCRVWLPTPGDEVYAILTTGQTIVKGDFLCSNADGTLKKHVAESSDYYQATDVTVKPLQIVAVATEAVTTTSATARICIRIV